MIGSAHISRQHTLIDIEHGMNRRNLIEQRFARSAIGHDLTCQAPVAEGNARASPLGRDLREKGDRLAFIDGAEHA